MKPYLPTHDYHKQMHNYIYDTDHLTDYTAAILKATPIFIQNTIPNIPVIRNISDNQPRLHIKGQLLLYVLHKLNIRPSP